MADVKEKKEEEVEDINKLVKIVPGRITVLKIMPYKGCPVYIRKIDEDMFEYLLIFEGQIYANYVIFTPEEGEKLTDKQINGAAGVIFTAATVTIDELFKKKEEALLSNPLPKTKIKQRIVN